MLLAAVMGSIGATVDRFAVQNTHPLLWAAAISTVRVLTIFPLMVRERGQRTRLQPAMIRHLGSWMIVAILAGGIGTGAYAFAMSMLEAGYVAAFKQTAGLFSILLGAWMFQEREIRTRFAGGSLMVAGAVAIILLG